MVKHDIYNESSCCYKKRCFSNKGSFLGGIKWDLETIGK